MKENIIVITGGTRGIGYALTQYFLSHGQKVVFSGRSTQSVDTAVSQLAEDYLEGNYLGVVADVTSYEDSQHLIDSCINQYGRMDILINNAGIDQHKQLFKDLSQEDISRVISINLTGTMQTTNAALQYYQTVDHGAIYMMEGFGSDDRMGDEMVVYGTTKRGIRYFTRSLAKEMADTNIIIGALSPGMVTTDLIKESLASTPSERAESYRKILNILADTPENVASFLGYGVLHNTKNNAKIFFLTTPKVLWRFIKSIFVKRSII